MSLSIKHYLLIFFHRYLLGFMAYLVEKGVFRKIKVSFLMVGHTHEDIDQVFSKYVSSNHHPLVFSSFKRSLPFMLRGVG